MRKPRKKKKMTPRAKNMRMAKKKGRLKVRQSRKNNYSWLTAGKDQNYTPNIEAMFKKKKEKK